VECQQHVDKWSRKTVVRLKCTSCRYQAVVTLRRRTVATYRSCRPTTTAASLVNYDVRLVESVTATHPPPTVSRVSASQCVQPSRCAPATVEDTLKWRNQVIEVLQDISVIWTLYKIALCTVIYLTIPYITYMYHVWQRLGQWQWLVCQGLYGLRQRRRTRTRTFRNIRFYWTPFIPSKTTQSDYHCQESGNGSSFIDEEQETSH